MEPTPQPTVTENELWLRARRERYSDLEQDHDDIATPEGF